MICQCVCRSVIVMSRAKMTEPIEVPFGLRTWVCPRNHVSDGSRSPIGGGNFEDEGAAHCKVYCGELCKKLLN